MVLAYLWYLEILIPQQVHAISLIMPTNFVYPSFDFLPC